MEHGDAVKSGVYTIRHLDSGNSYVGSAYHLARRIADHKRKLRSGRHSNKKLQNAWNLYGEASFSFATILECEKRHVLFYEQRAIDTLDTFRSGYNLRPRADNNGGWKMGPAGREKLRAAHSGRKQSAETIQKRADTVRGTKRSPETKERMAEAQRGKKMSLEARAKMSSRIYSPELRAKMSAIKTGVVMSEETKKKMSASAKAWRVRARDLQRAESPTFTPESK